MRICFVTDTHLVDRHIVFNDNLEKILTYINDAKFDAVIHLGDVVVDGIVHPAQFDFARQSFAGLAAPIRYLAGNHDNGDAPGVPGQQVHQPLDLDRLGDFRRVFGPDYWSFDADGWQLVGIDSQLLGTGTEAEEAQFAWLAETLAAGTGPVGLLSHKPLVPYNNPNAPAERYPAEPARQRLFALLAGRELKFIASGHVHQRRSFVLDGIEHSWVPSASFCMPDAAQAPVGEKVVGITALEVSADGSFRFEVPVVEGLVRYNPLEMLDVFPSLRAMAERLGDAARL